MLHRRTEETVNVKFMTKLRRITIETFNLLHEANGLEGSVTEIIYKITSGMLWWLKISYVAVCSF